MRKVIITAVLTLGAVFLVPSSALAEQTCVDKVLDPIIQIPIEVCVDVPGVPSVPPLPSLPAVPPIEVLPGTPEPTPPAPSPTVEPTPSSEPVEVVDEPEIVTTPTEEVYVPTVRDVAVTKFEELAFPVTVFLALLAVLYGASQLFGFLEKRKAKRLDNQENVL